jgi:putative peptidoglycan lipid II flippase
VARPPSRHRPTLLADSTRASAAAIAGYAPGFFVPIAIAAVFGANARTDAFFLALSAASLVANAAGVTAQQAAIPFLVDARRGGDVGRFVGEIAAALLILAAIPTVVLNGAVLWYIARGAEWHGHDAGLLGQLLWLFVPYIGCSVLAGAYAGALNAEHLYGRAALSPAVRSTIVLAAVLGARALGLYALVIGYLLGEAARCGWLFAILRRQYPVRVLCWPSAANLATFSRTAVAQMLGSGVVAFLPLLDRLMAASLGPGSLSLLDYADRLWQVPVAFAMSGFMVTSLSHWSEGLHRRGGTAGLSSVTARTAAWVFLLFLGPSVAFVIARAPIMRLVFGSGKFTPGDLTLLTDALAMLVAGTPVYIAGLIYTRAFLVLKRADWLLAINVVQIVLKVVLNRAFIPAQGLVGIALASVVTYAVSSLLLVALFHLRLASAAGAPIVDAMRTASEAGVER